MKKIEEVKVFGLTDGVKRLGKLKPANGGERIYYSYGGIFSAMRRRWPGIAPVPHGVYILQDNIPLADEAMNARERCEPVAQLPWKATDICGLKVANIAEYAAHTGLSLSAVRKVYYADNSPIRHLFFEWAGGYAFTEEKLNELVAWIKQHGNRPRARKLKRSLSHRRGAGKLNTAITEAAVKIDTSKEKEGTL